MGQWVPPDHPPANVWWLRHGWPLAGSVIVLIVLSLAARRWGKWAVELARADPDLSADPPARQGPRVRFVAITVRLLSNTALLAGVLVTAALVLCALAPGLFAPYGPDERLGILQLVDGVVEGAPFAPNPQYPLGSDPRSRDILSLLIYGARNTLAVVAAVTLVRLLIGGFLGIVAGWRRGALGHQILSFTSLSGSIPSLLFAYIFVVSANPKLGFPVFLLGMGLTGWAEWANTLNGYVRWARSQPFFEGALVLGSTPAHIVRRHLAPVLAPHLLHAAAMEVGAAMLLLAELGFLGVFMGEDPGRLIPQETRAVAVPEWAAMLAGSRIELFYRPWMPLFPALAFLVAILGFNLLGLGARAWLDPARSRA